MISSLSRLWRIHPLPVDTIPIRIPASVGRGPKCDLKIPHSDASRLHASIELRDDSLCVVDQGSRNGVYVNGKRVGVAPLEVGQILRIAQHVFWYAPGELFSQTRETILHTHATSLEPMLLVGETGAGRRVLVRGLCERGGRNGPLLTAVGRVETPTWRAAKGGVVVCEEPEDFPQIVAASSRYDVRLFGLTTRELAVQGAWTTVFVPPLRERRNELPALVSELFASRNAPTTYDADFLEALACYPFPVNINELDALARQFAGVEGSLGIQHLPAWVRAPVVEARASVFSVADLTRDQLHDALSRHRGNIRRVAQELGVPRPPLYRVLASFGLNPDTYRSSASSSDASEAVSETRRTGS